MEFFSQTGDVEAVILVGSCARGKAGPDSCVDMAVLVRPEVLATERHPLETAWKRFYESEPVFEELRAVGAYSHVDVDFIDGCFVPQQRRWTSGPDELELEVGNALVYGQPLWQGSEYYSSLRERWLPYYDERLRRKRLCEVRRYCLNNLDHIPLFVDRGLHFQAFHRLYDAFREFLQALFISRRTYPIAYDKWIREQVVDILGLPELYGQLVQVISTGNIESGELAGKAAVLRSLADQYAVICE